MMAHCVSVALKPDAQESGTVFTPGKRWARFVVVINMCVVYSIV